MRSNACRIARRGRPELEARLATIEGAQGVYWPRPEIVIAVGPRVLAFVGAATGALRQRHTFPP